MVRVWQLLRPGLGVGPVPLDGPLEALTETDLRLPAGDLGELRRVDELRVDLPGGVAAPADIGLNARARDLADQFEHAAHRPGLASPCVERLAGRGAADAHRPLDREVGGDSVVDVEEVALGGAVGADNRAAAVDHRRSEEHTSELQ